MKLEMKKGVDILSGLGGITAIDEAQRLFNEKC